MIHALKKLLQLKTLELEAYIQVNLWKFTFLLMTYKIIVSDWLSDKLESKLRHVVNFIILLFGFFHRYFFLTGWVRKNLYKK